MTTRGWMDFSDMRLAARIQRSAFAMTMFIVIVVGGVLLVLTLIEIRNNQQIANQNTATVVGEVLSGDIRNQLGNLRPVS